MQEDAGGRVLTSAERLLALELVPLAPLGASDMVVLASPAVWYGGGSGESVKSRCQNH